MKLSYANSLNLEESKICRLGKGQICTKKHSCIQRWVRNPWLEHVCIFTSNSKLFTKQQMESISRWQNKCEWKIWNLFWEEKKILWEKEKMLVTRTFSFSYNVFKRLLFQGRYKSGFCCKGLRTFFIFFYKICKTLWFGQSELCGYGFKRGEKEQYMYMTYFERFINTFNTNSLHTSIVSLSFQLFNWHSSFVCLLLKIQFKDPL